MLTEIRETRQVEGEPRRRWFLCRDLELLVWLDEADDMVGFRIVLRRSGEPIAVIWWKHTGLLHHRVDDGESRPGRYKSTPILMTAKGAVDVSALIRRLLAAGAGIETGIISSVVDILDAYARDSPTSLTPSRGTGDI